MRGLLKVYRPPGGCPFRSPMLQLVLDVTNVNPDNQPAATTGRSERLGRLLEKKEEKSKKNRMSYFFDLIETFGRSVCLSVLCFVGDKLNKLSKSRSRF